MATTDATVVLAHGAWADGSSWARVITALKAAPVKFWRHRFRSRLLPTT